MTFISDFAKLRDSVLVIGAILYASGYAVWSYHMWDGGLGFLPALDPQYFIAGIVPTILIALFWLSVTRGRKWANQIYSKLGPNASGRWAKARRISKFIPILGIILFLIDAALYSSDVNEVAVFVIQIISYLLVIIPILLVPDMCLDPNKTDRLTRFFQWTSEIYRKVFSYYLLIAIVLIALILYVQLGYPLIPQELGGIKPKPAILEFQSGILSTQSLSELAQDTGDDGVVRSIELEALFYSNERLIVRDANNPNSDKLYELKRSNVETIIWIK